MARLGTVALNGATYYHNEDLNEVRAFLRDAGLDLHDDKPVYKGWCSRDERKSGAIYFSDKGEFVGAYWSRED